MNARRTTRLLLASLGLSGVLLWLLLRPQPKPRMTERPAAVVDSAAARSANEIPKPTPSEVDETKRRVARELLANLQRLLARRDARRQEGLLTFKDEAAYRRLLARAAQAGLTVVDQLDGMGTA